MKEIFKNNGGQALQRCSGQAMLVAMLFMSGLILSSTAVVGMLLGYQIRQAIDASASTQSIFAADAGIEESLYCYFHTLRVGGDKIDVCNKKGIFAGGGSYSTKMLFKKQVPDGYVLTEDAGKDDVVLGIRITSTGEAGRTLRILEGDFDVR